ncbi:hypothetical protein [Bradyrhizobium canariense]|uniref:Cytochrome C n=1 Tax=Bradyrhizobium canariense TaxID=255045 RepID=A0A1H1SZA0_9BRAD|nr:hypothetical protein [Bradyrhizobium canariense]SDS52729.1 hypothetical protein SAMN05444158_2329 [Bradyrhizobium canariense]
MRLRTRIMTLLMAFALTPIALAQSDMTAAADGQYVPRLGDIMNAIQTRHMKLWFAGKSSNWGLAAYELGQLKAGLVEAASMYTGIPATNVNTMGEPVQSISDAIEARDGRRFSKAVDELTAGCNACHRSMERDYIVIRVPDISPFSDQVFAPQNKH